MRALKFVIIFVLFAFRFFPSTAQEMPLGFVKAQWHPTEDLIALNRGSGLVSIVNSNLESIGGLVKAQTQPQTDIRSELLPPGCSQACFLGIIPGVTTREEMEAIFSAQSIAYTRNELQPLGGLFIYDIFYQGNSNILDFNARIAADATARVETVYLSLLSPIPVETIIAQFGYPNFLRGANGSTYLVYRDYGLLFRVADSDPTNASGGFLLIPKDMNGSIRRFVGGKPCTSNPYVCSLPTVPIDTYMAATSTPTVSPTFTPTATFTSTPTNTPTATSTETATP